MDSYYDSWILSNKNTTEFTPLHLATLSTLSIAQASKNKVSVPLRKKHFMHFGSTLNCSGDIVQVYQRTKSYLPVSGHQL